VGLDAPSVADVDGGVSARLRYRVVSNSDSAQSAACDKRRIHQIMAHDGLISSLQLCLQHRTGRGNKQDKDDGGRRTRLVDVAGAVVGGCVSHSG